MNTKSIKVRTFNRPMIAVGLVLLLIGGGILAGNLFGSTMTGPIIMFSFAFIFFSLLLWSKKNWWAILPGGLLLSGGIAATLDVLAPDSKITGSIFLFTLAAAFFLIAVLARGNWWAILPGGLFLSIGLTVALNAFIPTEDYYSLGGTLRTGAFLWVLLLGMAGTFGVLWLLRKIHSTGWAIVPAAGFFTVAVMALVLGNRFGEAWLPSTILGVGVMVLASLIARGRKISTGNPASIPDR